MIKEQFIGTISGNLIKLNNSDTNNGWIIRGEAPAIHNFNPGNEHVQIDHLVLLPRNQS